MASFDHNGNIMTNSGRLNEIFAGRLHNASEGFPDAQIPDDTDQGRAFDAEQATGGNGRSRFGRNETLRAERFDEIQPGDWLWVYNANASNTGNHSLIFVRWMSGTQPNEPNTSENPQPLYYRTALCYSQPSVDRGGVQHISNLGNRYDREKHVSAITRVRRSSDNNTTLQPEDLIPRLNNQQRMVMTNANRDYFRRLGRAGNHFDFTRFLDWLRVQNTERIAHISNRLSPQQIAVYQTANQGTILEQMVMLYQRLKQLNENSDLLEATIQENATTRGLNARHETNVNNRANLNQEIASLTSQSSEPNLTRAQRRRLAELREQLADLTIHEPYSMSHPGNLPQRSQIVVDGLVENACSVEELTPFIIEGNEANP
jgi:hypothetical protein